MIERSCGTIPYTVKNGVIYYLIIKARNGSYGFPKGHIEAGENEEQTALRETLEETSLTPTLTHGFQYEMTYKMDNGNNKHVKFFLADFKSQMPKHNSGFENFDYFILPFEKAYKRLSFENTKEMLVAANSFLIKTI